MSQQHAGHDHDMHDHDMHDHDAEAEATLRGPIIQTVPLGPQWPTIDPFLFCANHSDNFPAGNGELAPVDSLKGRSIGSDFSGKDGWSMYHGGTVPGFPQHPHRGFETVTVVRQGYIDHSDSLGATARFGDGDVQWMTAGAGIVHCEMFPMLNTVERNPMHMFQIWMNLPSVDKMVPAYFTMLWNETIPVHHHTDDAGRKSEITMIAGALPGYDSPTPPPNSWAARPEADVAIWHIRLDAHATITLPKAASDDTVRTLYVHSGETVTIGGHEVEVNTGNVVMPDRAITLTAGPKAVQIVMLQGRPIGEPVAQYGPFVMNDQAEIEQAFADYRRTQFGGWPWSSDDPTHGDMRSRFARHPDGRVDEPPSVVRSH
jgi:quercetin 2,3-dioxygenase